ncbi:hypothetical protein PR048_007522 [Dryococelus australis]|uniref:Uncharacterized protein n=1 Tax=Dryococelus australis TaxID=614101 RepID=A0ABQ9HUX2_9NEOP|nr:hypothetical protein PR048_007522 [Dryococelus australis]
MALSILTSADEAVRSEHSHGVTTVREARPQRTQTFHHTDPDSTVCLHVGKTADVASSWRILHGDFPLSPAFHCTAAPPTSHLTIEKRCLCRVFHRLSMTSLLELKRLAHNDVGANWDGTRDLQEGPEAATTVGATRRPWSGAGMKGRGKPEIPEKTRRLTASSGTIPTRENSVTRPGIEPGSPWWEASRLTAQPAVTKRSLCRTAEHTTMQRRNRRTQRQHNIMTSLAS